MSESSIQRQLDNHEKIMVKFEKFTDEFTEKFNKFDKKVEVALAQLPEQFKEMGDKRWASKVYERWMYGLGGALILALIGLGSFIVEKLIDSKIGQ